MGRAAQSYTWSSFLFLISVNQLTFHTFYVVVLPDNDDSICTVWILLVDDVSLLLERFTQNTVFYYTRDSTRPARENILLF